MPSATHFARSALLRSRRETMSGAPGHILFIKSPRLRSILFFCNLSADAGLEFLHCFLAFRSSFSLSRGSFVSVRCFDKIIIKRCGVGEIQAS